jgi:arylsulfatase
VNRSLALAVTWLVIVLAVLVGASLWWRDQLLPDVRVDRALRLEPVATPKVVGLPQVAMPLPNGTRLAWRLPAERPGLRFDLEIPGENAVLRFQESFSQGLPDVSVRLTRADGTREEAGTVTCTEGAWGLQRVPLPVEAGEQIELELVAVDGRGRAGLGEALVADVVLESDGRPVDETAVAVPVESVVVDLLSGTAVDQRNLPATEETAAVGLPGPRGLVLTQLTGLDLSVDRVPRGSRLELVLHAARTSTGPLEPTHVTVRLDDEQVARVRVDETADPPGDAPPFHQLLVTVDLLGRAGRPLDVRLELTGSDNLVVAAVDCVLVQRTTNPAREHDPLKGRNLLLVAVEGLRADRLGAYGYERGHTPNLDALAQRGLVYTRALAPSGWSLPNLATLFTGLSPLAHGIGLAEQRVLDPRITTLARSAGWAGLTSACFSSSTMPLPSSGVLAGFGEVVIEPTAAPVLAERAADWLADAGSFGWFLTLVLSDPTWPHEPELMDLGAVMGAPDPALVERLRQLDSRPGAAEGIAQEVGTFYDAEVARVDRALGQLLGHLEQEGLLERTVVAVVGVHGQEFHEHGGRLQGRTLYDEIVHLPLILAGPGVVRPEEAPVVVHQPVPLADVTHLLGYTGRILSTGSISDRVPPPFGPDRPGATLHAILRPISGVTNTLQHASRRDDLLLLRDPLTGAEALFDLAADPGALDDLLQDPDDEVAAAHAQAMREAFDAWYEEELTDGPVHPRRWQQP